MISQKQGEGFVIHEECDYGQVPSPELPSVSFLLSKARMTFDAQKARVKWDYMKTPTNVPDTWKI